MGTRAVEDKRLSLTTCVVFLFPSVLGAEPRAYSGTHFPQTLILHTGNRGLESAGS